MPRRLLKNVRITEVSHCRRGVNPHASVVLFKSRAEEKEPTMYIALEKAQVERVEKAVELAKSYDAAAASGRSVFEKALDDLAHEERTRAGWDRLTHEQAYARVMKSPPGSELAHAAKIARNDDEPERPEPVQLTKAERHVDQAARELQKVSPSMTYEQAYAAVLKGHPGLQDEVRRDG